MVCFFVYRQLLQLIARCDIMNISEESYEKKSNNCY